jgi:hypothetical protein
LPVRLPTMVAQSLRKVLVRPMTEVLAEYDQGADQL